MQKIFNFKKDDIITIPNILTFLRIALVPFIVWLYLKQEYYWSLLLIALSAITDVVDGIIARKCNAVSDFGKIIDPFADKLTQFALLACLTNRYHLMFWMIGFFVMKEVFQALLGFLAVRKQSVVNSSKWFGKASTVVLYAVIMALILFPKMDIQIANGLILFSAGMLGVSLFAYCVFYFKILLEKND